MRHLCSHVAVWILLGTLLLHAQQPLRGVVWEQPPDLEQATLDLMTMERIGVEAVRTGLITAEPLLTLADSLGLHLFQEIPVAHVPAGRLRDTLAFARRALAEALVQARTHPSARHFGLVRATDTAHPAACAYVSELARQVRADGPSGSRVYYVTAFVEEDQCGDAVDVVLLDVPEDIRPEVALSRWRQAHGSSSAGIGRLGTWVDDAAFGLLAPYSPERQARFFEQHLDALLDADQPVPYAVFVHRWRDAPELPFPWPSGARRPEALQTGLHRADGTPRPAAKVVRGFYTGGQTVFAFPAGTPAAASIPWSILLGWGIVAALGVSYAGSLRFRRMIPRYFLARGFYQEAIRGGREIPVLANAVLFVAISLSAGMLGDVVLHAWAQDATFAQFMHWMPEGMQRFVVTLLDQPVLLILLLGSLYALSLAFWMLMLIALARTQQRLLSAVQALAVVVWPCWPLLPLMAAALAVQSLPPEPMSSAALVLVVAYLAVTLWSIEQTLRDYQTLFPASFGLMTAAAFLHPLVLFTLFLLIAVWQRGAYVVFLWHLATGGE